MVCIDAKEVDGRFLIGDGVRWLLVCEGSDDGAVVGDLAKSSDGVKSKGLFGSRVILP